MKSRFLSYLKWKEVPVWLRAAGVVAIVNFACFSIIAIVSGGDAVNGKEEGGKCFLGNHGRNTEVTKTFFEYSQYSRIHAMTVWIAHSIAILGALGLSLRKKENG